MFTDLKILSTEIATRDAVESAFNIMITEQVVPQRRPLYQQKNAKAVQHYNSLSFSPIHPLRESTIFCILCSVDISSVIFMFEISIRTKLCHLDSGTGRLLIMMKRQQESPKRVSITAYKR